MYPGCSFRYVLDTLDSGFISFWKLALVGFLLLCRNAIFTLSRFFLTAKVSYGTLCFPLSLVGMHSAAASMWAFAKFWYSSLEVIVPDIFNGKSYLFLCIMLYSSLMESFIIMQEFFLIVLPNSVSNFSTQSRKFSAKNEANKKYLVYWSLTANHKTSSFFLIFWNTLKKTKDDSNTNIVTLLILKKLKTSKNYFDSPIRNYRLESLAMFIWLKIYNE